MDFPIENKIAKANINQIDLMDYVNKEPIIEFDLKGFLWQEMIIKEKEFRQNLKETDWSIFADKTVALYCSVDAIIPSWAFMLVTSYLIQVNAKVLYGTKKEIEEDLFFENLKNIKNDSFVSARVMVKGCSNIPNPTKAYITLTNYLQPLVKSLMFGEPCSAVPVFKKK